MYFRGYFRWAAAGEPEKAVTLVKRLRSHGFLPSLATYETLVWGFAQVRYYFLFLLSFTL